MPRHDVVLTAAAEQDLEDIGDYIAVYRIEDQVVTVVRVVQGSRDISRILHDGERDLDQ